MQSQSNQSLHPNSLLTGNRTRNFVESARLVRFSTPTQEQVQELAAIIPYSNEQGIIFTEQGILDQEQGIWRAKIEIIAG